MENPNLKPNNLEQEDKKDAPLVPKKPKPDIEGITIPAAGKTFRNINPKLTSEEQKLIEETSDAATAEAVKPVSPKITLPERKPHYFARTLLTLVILGALGFGGYKAYWWYLQKQEPIDLSFAQEQASPSAEDTAAGDLASSSLSGGQSAAEPETKPTSSLPSLAEAERVKIKATETGWLNVRQEPSTASAIITKVYPEDMFIYTEVKNGWYKIVLPDKTTGWVSGQYVIKM